MTTVDPVRQGAPAESFGLSTEVAERLNREFQQLTSKRSIKHAVVGIESLDGSYRWARAAGNAHPGGSPMRVDTPIWIASVTKLYIASSVLKLYERGLVELDVPIANYLPRSLVSGIHRLGGVDYTDAITVRHLLGHMSGLPDFLEDRPKDGPSLLERAMEEDFSWTVEEAMEFVRDSLTPHFPPQPLTSERPRIRYSDTNYQLLIAIIERVSGLPLHEAFDELIYKPVGLRNTFHPGTDAERDARTATIWADDDQLDIPGVLISCRDLASTVDDMLMFMRALIRGQLFEDEQTLSLMRTGWNTFGFSLNPMPTSPGWPIQYSLGMMRFRIPRLLSPFRRTPDMIGHTGVSGSWLFYSPDLDVMLAGTVDQFIAAPVPFRVVPKLLQILDTD